MDTFFTKQDIMNKKMDGIIKIIIRSYLKILKAQITQGEKDKDILNYIGFSESLKSFDVLANIFYEAFLDIKSLSPQEFNECIDQDLFKLSDLKKVSKVNSFIKVLVFNALTMDEKHSLYEEMIARIHSQKMSPSEAYSSILNELPPDKRKYLELIQDPNFDYKSLDEEGLEILNNHHKSFMSKEILPYVTETLDSKKNAELSAKLLKKITPINVEVEFPMEESKKFNK